MSVPSQPIMAQDSTAGTTAFSPKSAADRTTSYMWYVHVLVKVNTEERLRANIAPLLAHSTVCSTFASPARSGGLLSPEANLTSNAGSSGYAADDQQSRLHEMTDDLTDYLILWLFNHKILARLVESPPILEQAIGYTHSLSDVPEAYREEFCRRLYTLLFSKRVVEWPHGIDVPVPAVAAAQPVVIATGKTTAGVMELDGTRLEHSWPPTDVPSQDDNDNMIDNKNNNNNSDNRYPSIRAASRAAGSIWMRTPSPSTFGYDSEMERGGYFGTVDNPMPLNSLGNLGRSRNGYGPPPPVGTSDRQGESASRGQPMPPFPSPQQIGITPVVFQTPTQILGRDEPPSPPHAREQRHVHPSVKYGYDARQIGCEGGTYPLDRIDSGVGRPVSGHMIPEQCVSGNERRVWDRGWNSGSPAAGYLQMPAHHRPSSHMLLPLAAQAEARQRAQGRRRWEKAPEGVRVKSSQGVRTSGWYM